MNHTESPCESPCEARLRRRTGEVEALLDAALAHPRMYGDSFALEHHVLLLLQFHAALTTDIPFPSRALVTRWHAWVETGLTERARATLLDNDGSVAGLLSFEALHAALTSFVADERDVF